MMTSLSYSHYWVGLYLGIPFQAIIRTDDAFRPNTVQVHVDDRVIWTNYDLQPHSFKSCQSGQQDAKSYSSIMSADTTFGRRFTEVGSYRYTSVHRIQAWLERLPLLTSSFPFFLLFFRVFYSVTCRCTLFFCLAQTTYANITPKKPERS